MDLSLSSFFRFWYIDRRVGWLGCYSTAFDAPCARPGRLARLSLLDPQVAFPF